MIAILALAVVLFFSASLGWGFVFSADFVRLGKRVLTIFILASAVLSVFAAVFLLKGSAGLEYNHYVLVASILFTLSFVFSFAVGFVFSTHPRSKKMFSYIENILKPGKEDREGIIDEILDIRSESGKIDVLERELIESVLKFNDKTVREVMVPRGDIAAIDIDEYRHHFLHKVIEEGYSRLPVYRGSIDNILGIIYAKDLLTMVENEAVIVLHDLLRPPHYVPVTKKISQLLREMQRDKVHLAVVVDEFGGTEGIVTLEDVLEEIVGEIQDEYDESLSELVRDPNGDVHISGSMTVNRFNELLGADVPQSDDYDTVAGFVQKLAGKLPQEDEIYSHGEMFFIVEEVARHRIKRLRISFKEHPAQEEGGGGPEAGDDASSDLNLDKGFQQANVGPAEPTADRPLDFVKKKNTVAKKKSSKAKSARKPGKKIQ